LKGTAAAAVVVVVAVLGVLYVDFLADDAYITLAFARSLVQTGTPSLGGEAVHAISSPLWFGLSTVLVAVFGTDLAPLALKAASALGTVASAFLLLALVRRLHDDARLHGLALALLLADAWIGRWSWSGMEASWAVAAVLLGLLLRERGRAVEAAILLATVGVQLRPELGLLAMLLIGEATFRPPEPSVALARRLTFTSAVGVLLLIGWGVLAMHWFGRIDPRTVEAKAGALAPLQSAMQAARVVGAGQGVSLLLLATGGVVAIRRAALPLAWLLALVGFYVVRGYEPLSRYLILGTAALPAYAAAGIDRRWARPAGALAVVIGAVVTLWIAVPASTGDVVRFYRDVVEEIEPGEALATWEIGALGYYGDLRVVDLAGLVLDESLAPWNDRPRRLLRETRPRYCLTRYDIDGLGWTEVLVRDVRGTLAGDRGATSRMVLWELDWTGVPP